MSQSFRQIGEEYNEQMIDILLSSPMESAGLSLCLDRSPDMFAVAKLFFDSYKCFGFFLDEELVGYVMICRKKAYVKGIPREIGYLANLYIRKEGRKLGWYFRFSEPIFREALDEVGIGYATTIKGNRNTEPMIGRRISKYRFVPFSKTIATNITHNILITFNKRNVQGYSVRRATDDDIPVISRLLDNEYRPRLFGSVMTEDNLRKAIAKRPGFTVSDYFVAEYRGRIVGTCSAWDISSVRRVRVMAYRGKYRIVKMIYGWVAPVFGFPKLPDPGQPFREIVINDFAVEGRSPEILQALVTQVYRTYRKLGYNMIQIASDERDPILVAVRGFFTQPLRSWIIFGADDPDRIEKDGIDCSNPYLDISGT